MKIDVSTGVVTLQSGFSFGSTTPLATFRAHRDCKDWSEDGRACSIVVSKVENRPLKLQLSFIGDLVLNCNLEINLYDHDPPFTWDEFSYEIQVRELEIYRKILSDSLGKPNKTLKSSIGGDDFPILNQYQIWDLGWGSACVGAHPKDGFVRGGISYKRNQPRIAHESEQEHSLLNRLANTFRRAHK
jgi:hypothetical protein